MNWKQAIADYNLALDFDPDHWSIYPDRAQSYQDLGKIELAFDDYSLAIAIARGKADAYFLETSENAVSGERIRAIFVP